MSRGKYSPTVIVDKRNYDYNCYGKIPAEFSIYEYDEKTMFANYDKDGFDRYGYSAFDLDGNYVGIGAGVDRAGYTENDYLVMDDQEYSKCL